MTRIGLLVSGVKFLKNKLVRDQSRCHVYRPYIVYIGVDLFDRNSILASLHKDPEQRATAELSLMTSPLHSEAACLIKFPSLAVCIFSHLLRQLDLMHGLTSPNCMQHNIFPDCAYWTFCRCMLESFIAIRLTAFRKA